MQENKRKELAALLVELSINELHGELDRAWDNHDRKKAEKLCEVQDAITTLLAYLEN